MAEIMNNDFPDGILVALKSGGPLMTVEDTRSDGIVSVVWFDGYGLHRDAFHPAQLHRYQRLEPGVWPVS